MTVRNVGIVPHQYVVSQPRRPQLNIVTFQIQISDHVS